MFFGFVSRTLRLMVGPIVNPTCCRSLPYQAAESISRTARDPCALICNDRQPAIIQGNIEQCFPSFLSSPMHLVLGYVVLRIMGVGGVPLGHSREPLWAHSFPRNFAYMGPPPDYRD